MNNKIKDYIIVYTSLTVVSIIFYSVYCVLKVTI